MRRSPRCDGPVQRACVSFARWRTTLRQRALQWGLYALLPLAVSSIAAASPPVALFDPARLESAASEQIRRLQQLNCGPIQAPQLPISLPPASRVLWLACHSDGNDCGRSATALTPAEQRLACTAGFKPASVQSLVAVTPLSPSEALRQISRQLGAAVPLKRLASPSGEPVSLVQISGPGPGRMRVTFTSTAPAFARLGFRTVVHFLREAPDLGGARSLMCLTREALLSSSTLGKSDGASRVPTASARFLGSQAYRCYGVRPPDNRR